MDGFGDKLLVLGGIGMIRRAPHRETAQFFLMVLFAATLQ
jgi:hypothetical protein